MDRTEAKKGIGKFGVLFGIAAGLIIGVEYLVAYLVSPLMAGAGLETRVLATFGLTILGVDMVGFPAAYFLCKGLPKGELGHEKIGFWKYVLGIIIAAGLCLAGTIVGLPIHLLLTAPFGVSLSDSSTLGILMMNSGLLPRMITVGILAPIFEELIFRKVLVDHLSHYSKYMAVLVSGIAFGLFHGNFQQFFYAMFLGWFFAYIYVKTGNIKYTIGYHMMINLTSSVVTMFLTAQYMEFASNLDMATLAQGKITEEMVPALIMLFIYGAYMFFLFVIGVAGIVLVIVKWKSFKLTPVETELPKKEAKKEAFTNLGLWVLYAVCLFLFVKTYVPNMLHPVEKITVSNEYNPVIQIENGETMLSSYTMPLEVTEASSGRLMVSMNSDTGESHFITGVVVRKPDGEINRTFTAGTMTAEYEMNSLDAGTYSVELYFLTNKQSFEAFSKEYLQSDEGEEDWDGPDEDFYQDGSYPMNYSFSMEYKVRK